MPTSRIEAFSDGVFAVAITLLIFNVQPPHVGEGELGPALLALWPAYASYVVSFLTIGIIWVNHHALFKLIRQADRPLLFLNIGLLMVVAFLPFPTALFGEYIPQSGNSHVAALVYGITMLLMSIGFSGLWIYTTQHPKLLVRVVNPSHARTYVLKFGAGIVTYLLAIVLALVDARLCLAIYFVTGVYYVFNQLPLGDVPNESEVEG